VNWTDTADVQDGVNRTDTGSVSQLKM
jgi:hypothetical protein